MTEKAKGGRGKKAADPYQRLSLTLPPQLKNWVDGEAQRQGMTRSAVVVQALTQAKQAAATAQISNLNRPSSGPVLKHRGKGKRR